jgi:hypothetical protein
LLHFRHTSSPRPSPAPHTVHGSTDGTRNGPIVAPIASRPLDRADHARPAPGMARAASQALLRQLGKVASAGSGASGAPGAAAGGGVGAAPGGAARALPLLAASPQRRGRGLASGGAGAEAAADADAAEAPAAAAGAAAAEGEAAAAGGASPTWDPPYWKPRRGARAHGGARPSARWRGRAGRLIRPPTAGAGARCSRRRHRPPAR